MDQGDRLTAETDRVARTLRRACRGFSRASVPLDDASLAAFVRAAHVFRFIDKSRSHNAWRRSCASLLFEHDHFDADSGAELLKSGIRRLEKF
jgi:hypothetical protein